MDISPMGSRSILFTDTTTFSLYRDPSALWWQIHGVDEMRHEAVKLMVFWFGKLMLTEMAEFRVPDVDVNTEFGHSAPSAS